MGQSFPSHLVIDSRWTVFEENRGHLGQVVAEPVVVFVVSDFPGGMGVEGEIFWRRGVVRRQGLGLEFKGGHDSFGLLGVRSTPC